MVLCVWHSVIEDFFLCFIAKWSNVMKNSNSCFDNDTLAIKDVIRHLHVH